MSTLQQNFKQYFNVLRILHLAMSVAVVVFGMVVHFVILPIQDIDAGNNSTLYVNLSAAYLVVAISIGYWLFGNQMKKAKESTSLSDKLNTYRSACIIRWALLEGAALVALVFYLLSGNLVLLALAGIGVLVLALSHPNEMRLKVSLDLNQAELDRLNDPGDQVAQSPLVKRF